MKIIREVKMKARWNFELKIEDPEEGNEMGMN